MIKSFGDKTTEKIFNGERVRRVSPKLEKGAIKKLESELDGCRRNLKKALSKSWI